MNLDEIDQPVCRGSFILGTACGTCARCKASVYSDGSIQVLKLNVPLGLSFEELFEFCKKNDFNFRVEYHEGSEEFEVHVTGLGQGEDFYVKKSGRLESAVERIKEQFKAFLHSTDRP